jgi:hypothetical protein
MIKIYKYNHQDERFITVVNDNTLKGKERNEAIDNWVKENGTEVSLKDYFSDCDRNNWRKDYAYRSFGKAENCIERLAWGEIEYDDDLSYCTMKNLCPEDLIESRTKWDEMKSYADGLYYFIVSLKNEITEGKIILA